MMRIVLLLLITGVLSVANGQTDGNATNEQISLVFNQQEFGDRLSVLVYTDNDYNYYVIDLTKIGARFERVYFMNLTYSDHRIVNIDPDIEKDQTWFKSYYKYAEDEVTRLLKELKEKTEETCLRMTAEEKSAWMVKFDKFNKGNNNE